MNPVATFTQLFKDTGSPSVQSQIVKELAEVFKRDTADSQEEESPYLGQPLLNLADMLAALEIKPQEVEQFLSDHIQGYNDIEAITTFIKDLQAHNLDFQELTEFLHNSSTNGISDLEAMHNTEATAAEYDLADASSLQQVLEEYHEAKTDSAEGYPIHGPTMNQIIQTFFPKQTADKSTSTRCSVYVRQHMNVPSEKYRYKNGYHMYQYRPQYLSTVLKHVHAFFQQQD